MTRRERLLASLRGEPTDRTPVCFYEINGLDQDPEDPDPFNVFSHPSWKSTVALARDHSDRIVLRDLPWRNETCDANEVVGTKTWIDEAGNRFVRNTLHGDDLALATSVRQSLTRMALLWVWARAVALDLARTGEREAPGAREHAEGLAAVSYVLRGSAASEFLAEVRSSLCLLLYAHLPDVRRHAEELAGSDPRVRIRRL